MPKKNPVILITGASQGIGAAIAKAFAQKIPGCRLALVARSEKNLAAVARRCAKIGAGPVAIFPCDVSDARSVDAMAASVTERFGALDVLINNAGVFRPSPVFATAVADFDEILATNLRSVFLVSRALVPPMAKRGRGHVFNMGSIAGLNAYPNGAAYCAAKFGVAGLTKVMRMELRDKGVRVTAVHPGATFSPSWNGSGVPAERMMPAEDVAKAFVDCYLMSSCTVVEEIILRPQQGDI